MGPHGAGRREGRGFDTQRDPETMQNNDRSSMNVLATHLLGEAKWPETPSGAFFLERFVTEKESLIFCTPLRKP